MLVSEALSGLPESLNLATDKLIHMHTHPMIHSHPHTQSKTFMLFLFKGAPKISRLQKPAQLQKICSLSSPLFKQPNKLSIVLGAGSSELLTFLQKLSDFLC